MSWSCPRWIRLLDTLILAFGHVSVWESDESHEHTRIFAHNLEKFADSKSPQIIHPLPNAPSSELRRKVRHGDICSRRGTSQETVRAHLVEDTKRRPLPLGPGTKDPQRLTDTSTPYTLLAGKGRNLWPLTGAIDSSENLRFQCDGVNLCGLMGTERRYL